MEACKGGDTRVYTGSARTQAIDKSEISANMKI
jgi:hypothetical protein